MSKLYTAEYIQNDRLQRKDFYLPDIQTVRKEIFDSGGIPLTIRERKPYRWQRAWFSHSYKTRFLKSIALHVTGGMSAEKALMLTIQSETSTMKRRELQPAIDVLNGGGSFFDAISQIKLFGSAISFILHAGEVGGFMRDAVNLAIHSMEQKKKNLKMFFSWLSILFFDFFSAITFAFLFQFWFIPWVAKNGIQSNDPVVIEKFHSSLATVKSINGLLLVFILAVLVLVGFFVIAMLSRSGAMRRKVEVIISKIPIVRSFIYDGEISTTFSIVAKMLQRGIRIDTAFAVAEKSSVLPAVQSFWGNALQRLMRGDSVGRALDSPLLNHAERLEIKAHQNSEQLSNILEYISEERGLSYQTGIKRAVYFSLLFIVLYSAAIGFLGIKLLYIQNEGIMEGFKTISGGGF